MVQEFGDSAPQLRDLTVVCMHHMAPRMVSHVSLAARSSLRWMQAIEEGLLSEAKSDEIAKLLMRSMVDKEPVIRTNSVVCIGKARHHLRECGSDSIQLGGKVFDTQSAQPCAVPFDNEGS